MDFTLPGRLGYFVDEVRVRVLFVNGFSIDTTNSVPRSSNTKIGLTENKNHAKLLMLQTMETKKSHVPCKLLLCKL